MDVTPKFIENVDLLKKCISEKRDMDAKQPYKILKNYMTGFVEISSEEELNNSEDYNLLNECLGIYGSILTNIESGKVLDSEDKIRKNSIDILNKILKQNE